MSIPLTNITVVVVFIFLVVSAVMRSRRQRELRILAFRSRCGSEPERAVRQQDSSVKADAKLVDRAPWVDAPTVSEPSVFSKERIASEWQTTPSRFLDFPEVAVTVANDPVEAFRGSHGYPKDSIDKHAADISVTYHRVMEDYRAVHDVTVWQPGQDASSAEDFRAVMIQYRAIFDEILPGNGESSVRSRTNVSECSDSREVECDSEQAGADGTCKSQSIGD